MLNEYLMLQIVIIFIVLIIYWINDIFNNLNISILFLLALSLYSYLNDFDIFVSFLIIVDLGVFLILLTFNIHLLKFLILKNNINLLNLNFLNYLFFITLFFFYLIIILNYNTFNFNKDIEYVWFFYISYYNYYIIFNNFISSDLQIYKEIYFQLNNFEFFIMSILIYLSVLMVSNLISYLYKIYLIKNLNNIISNSKINKLSSITYIKSQNANKQEYTPGSSVIWNKTKKWSKN